MSVAQCLIRVVDLLYVPIVRRFVSRDIFGYALCGGANMALDTLWYFVIYHYIILERNVDLGVVVISPHIAALIVVFPITFFTGFLLNRYVAFRATQQRTTKQLFRYALSVVGSILLNYALMKFFVDLCHIWPTIAKIFTTAIVATYSYMAAKYYSFTQARQ